MRSYPQLLLFTLLLTFAACTSSNVESGAEYVEEKNQVEDGAEEIEDYFGEDMSGEGEFEGDPIRDYDPSLAYAELNKVEPDEAATLARAKSLGYNTDNIVRVSTIEELVAAIAPNTTIILAPGTYIFNDSDILGADQEGGPRPLDSLENLSPYYSASRIENVENLTLIGTGEIAPIIEQNDPYNHVFNFKNCKNLFLSNLILGHQPGTAFCQGGVLYFQDMDKVYIENSVLYGSGTEGMYCVTVNDLTFDHSEITDCSDQFSTFAHATHISFTNSSIQKNGAELRGFALYHAEIELVNTTIDQINFEFSCEESFYNQTYDMMFNFDDYDYGNWFANEFSVLAQEPQQSVVRIQDCLINEERIDCIIGGGVKSEKN